MKQTCFRLCSLLLSFISKAKQKGNTLKILEIFYEFANQSEKTILYPFFCLRILGLSNNQTFWQKKRGCQTFETAPFYYQLK